MKCVSACTQTQCDADAACSLVANLPTCVCNRGFLATTSATGSTACMRDVTCEELGCDVNAICQAAGQVRKCVCKSGYTGDGKTCMPVSCSVPTLTNGTVSTPDGITFGKTATYKCNAGFSFLSSVAGATRMCGTDGSWGAAVSACSAVDCGPLTVKFGTANTGGGTKYGSSAATFSCQSGFVLSGPAAAECQANGTWTAAPKCSGCGDGIISAELGETCEPGTLGQDIWSCSPSKCQKSTMYSACVSTFDCSPGENCFANGCSRSCSTPLDCPMPPTGRSATCSTACAVPCANAAGCAPGLVCSGGLCMKCDPLAQPPQCAQSMKCIVQNAGDNYGSCQ
jgi:hypothetical protein